MAKAEDIRRAVTAAFPKAERPAVLAALRGYSQRRESSRVRLAILVLADGDLAEVKRLVATANADYRDLLYWAEYPEESGSGTKKQMAARYRRLGVAVPSQLA